VIKGRNACVKLSVHSFSTRKEERRRPTRRVEGATRCSFSCTTKSAMALTMSAPSTRGTNAPWLSGGDQAKREFFHIMRAGTDSDESENEDDKGSTTEGDDPGTARSNHASQKKRGCGELQREEEIWRFYGGREAAEQREGSSLWQMCRSLDEFKVLAQTERREWLAWRRLLRERPFPPAALPSRRDVKLLAHTRSSARRLAQPLPVQIPSAMMDRERGVSEPSFVRLPKELALYCSPPSAAKAAASR
jgi:hypothetical protein